MEFRGRDGWIEVICGSMFAGKTEELIRRITRIQLAKREVVVFKPVIDNRYSKEDVVSHSQRRVKSIVVNTSDDTLDFTNKSSFSKFASVSEMVSIIFSNASKLWIPSKATGW